jgi:hypothetical protein
MGSGDRWSLLIEDQRLVHARIAGTDGLRLYVRKSDLQVKT